MGSSSGNSASASDSESGAKTGAAGATASGDDEEEGGASLVTTTDEDGTSITGQLTVITEDGSAITTIVPATGGGVDDDEETGTGGRHTKQGEGETGMDEDATETGSHTGLGGFPRLDTDTLVTIINGKETTLRGAWQQTLIGGVPLSSFLPMTLERRTAMPAAPTITPAPRYP